MTEIEARYCLARHGFEIIRPEEREEAAQSLAPPPSPSQEMLDRYNAARGMHEKNMEENEFYWVKGVIESVSGEIKVPGGAVKKTVTMNYFHRGAKLFLAFDIWNNRIPKYDMQVGEYWGVELCIGGNMVRATGQVFATVQLVSGERYKVNG